MSPARTLAVISLLAASACDGDARQSPLTIRVATFGGLAPMSPDVRATATANLLELVYLPLRPHVASIDRAERSATLVCRPRADCALVASSLRHPGIQVVRLEADRIDLRLDPSIEFSLDMPLLDQGPYDQESFTPERLVLRRRSGSGPDRIEVIAVTTEEEAWRQFLARRVDVLPFVSPACLRRLREIPTVRILPLRVPVQEAIYFNVGSSPMASLELRRAVALAIDRKALALSTVGDPGAARRAEEDVEESAEIVSRASGEHAVPLRLRLVIHAGDTDNLRQALLLKQMLGAVGITLTVVAKASTEMQATLAAGDFDLLLRSDTSWSMLCTLFHSHSRYAFFGYKNPQFEAAADAGDELRGRAILAADLALTPLIDVHQAAVIDSSLCADQPASVYDLSWLATVHRCRPGER